MPSLVRSLNRASRGALDGRPCGSLLAKVPFALQAILKRKGAKLPQNWEHHPKLCLPEWFDELVENLEDSVFSIAMDTVFESKWFEI